MISETVNGVDKVKRYGWETKNSPGEFASLHKDVLRIHPAYQRAMIPGKVKEVTSCWSWISCGAIVVGERGGEYWVIDGQHRVLAAKRRSDITHLPCLVFKTEGVKEEAIAFLDLNTGRKPVSSLGKFNAMITAGDQASLVVRKVTDDLGIVLKSAASKGKELKSVAWAVKRAAEDEEAFTRVMRAAAELCCDIPIQERLLDGLWYINERLPGGIESKRFKERLQSVGVRRLLDAANKAAAYFVRGGASVWAIGMMDEINKGLRNKFQLEEMALVNRGGKSDTDRV
jgi:hypothetical protein